MQLQITKKKKQRKKLFGLLSVLYLNYIALDKDA